MFFLRVKYNLLQAKYANPHHFATKLPFLMQNMQM